MREGIGLHRPLDLRTELARAESWGIELKPRSERTESLSRKMKWQPNVAEARHSHLVSLLLF
jgi:hypothetical protein